MGTTGHPDPEESTARLLEAVQRFVRGDHEAALRRYLRRRWSPASLVELVNGASPVVARVATYCLGVLGGQVAVLPLLGALHHDDASVASVAEDGLWRIWFGAAGPGARRGLLRAAEMIGQGRCDSAIAILEDIIGRNPGFAEGFHQRAMARVFQGDWAGAIGDYQRALSLNACHFGALCGMGHAHARLGHPHEALRCYRAALRIHPRMDGVRQSIRRVQPSTVPTRLVLRD